MKIEQATHEAKGVSLVGHERRNQLRVDARIEALLALDREPERFPVQNLDLSWGGASLMLPEYRLDVGESVRIELPWTHGRTIAAKAEVLRAQPVPDGCLASVRFSKLLLRHEQRLERLLTMLAADRGQPHHDVGIPLSQRIELDFVDPEDLRSTLEEISGGGYTVMSFRPYDVQQSLLLVLTWQGRHSFLRLRARIMDRRDAIARPPDEDGRAKAPMSHLYAMGLAFEHPLGDIKRAVDPLIVRLSRSDPKTRLAA